MKSLVMAAFILLNFTQGAMAQERERARRQFVRCDVGSSTSKAFYGSYDLEPSGSAWTLGLHYPDKKTVKTPIAGVEVVFEKVGQDVQISIIDASQNLVLKSKPVPLIEYRSEVLPISATIVSNGVDVTCILR